MQLFDKNDLECFFRVELHAFVLFGASLMVACQSVGIVGCVALDSDKCLRKGVVLRVVCVCSLVAFVLGGAACTKNGTGPLRVDVSGTVTLDGKPLQHGTIQFVPSGSTKGPATSGNVSDGTFELIGINGPIAGTHSIRVFSNIDLPLIETKEDLAKVAKLASEKKKLPKIPERYRKNSPIEATVSPSLNSFDFQLTSGRR